MAKFIGTALKFYFGTKGSAWVEQYRQNLLDASYDETYKEIELTDSASSIEEGIAGRADSSSQIKCILTDGDYTVIVGDGAASLTSGKKYRVVLGTVGSNSVGTEFISDGTEVPAVGANVIIVGTKITELDMSFSFGGTTVPMTSIKYNEAYKEVDVTDNGTTGQGSEFVVSNKPKATIDISVWMLDQTADLALKTSTAGVITFKTGVTASGNVILYTKKNAGEVQGAIKQDYTGAFNSLTKVMKSILPLAVENDCLIIYKDGTTTNKQVEGKAIITAIDISISKDNKAELTYTIRWNGAPTESVAN